MRLILLLSFLFLSLISVSQYPNGIQTIGNDSNLVKAKGGFQGRFININYTDTVAANLERIRQYPGAQIYTSSDNLLWYRNSAATAWVQISNGAGGLFARTDSRNNTGSNMYFSAADNSLTLDSIQNFNVNATSGSMNFISAGGINMQSDNTSSLTITTNYATYNNGDWGLKTVPTRTLSIGDDIGGVSTLSLYAPNATTAHIETRIGAALTLSSGNSIYFHPNIFAADGKIVISPTATVGYVAQKFYSGGGGPLGEIGLGVYDALNQEYEFYIKPFNIYDPIGMDSNQTYLNLYHKIKLTNIPNEDDLIKIIGIDDSNNVRYINASTIGGVNIYNSDGILTSPRLLTGNNGTNGLALDSLADFSVKSYDGSSYSGISMFPTFLQILYHGTTTDANIAILDGAVSISAGVHEISVSEDSIRMTTLGLSNDTTNRKIVTVNPTTKTLAYSNWIGGAGTIGGSIATNQAAFGSGANTIQGSAQFTFTGQALQLSSTNTTEVTTSSALAQTYNSLTSGTGHYLASSSLSSGRLKELVVTGTAGLTNQTGLLISLSGANATGAQTTYGLDVANTHTGTSTNVAARFTASGGSNNTAAIFTGRVAMGGVTTPFADLDVGAGTIAAGSITITGAAGTASNGNFSTSTTTILGTNTGSLYQYDGSTNSDGRVYIGGTGATAIGVGRPYSTLVLGAATVPEASSGNHPFIGSAIFIPPTITTGAATVTDAATVRITGPTTVVVSGTNSALLINSGNLRMDNGNISLNTAGNKLNIATGSNASVGVSGAMTAGTITISTTAVTASSRIFLTHATVSGTLGVLSVGTIVAGTSFVINSSSGTDASTINYWIIN